MMSFWRNSIVVEWIFFFLSHRILGGLISAHILLTDPKHPFGKVGFEGYDNELLHLAHDLAVRLLPAFENTTTGIPYPRVSDCVVAAGRVFSPRWSHMTWCPSTLPRTQVNLKTGVPPDSINETCTAGAGSLLVEFGILSRLIGDSTFEWVARRAVRALWNLRSNETGLLGRCGGVEELCSLQCLFLSPVTCVIMAATGQR